MCKCNYYKSYGKSPSVIDSSRRFWLSCLDPMVSLLLKTFKKIWISNLLTMSMCDEGSIYLLCYSLFDM